ncbi:hypothetical protein [Alicyclobacillus acidiphilus]|uniref:hypothetical protein n=2 Tax=Alicyclobacillus acidiphilus TaxID=182455 RepID=UPI0008354B31|nr:hypothetical protein [Alicyclobacillus acidiphilus]
MAWGDIMKAICVWSLIAGAIFGGVLGTGITVLAQQTPRTWGVMKPGGQIVYGRTYEEAVNKAGGRNLHHEFIYGHYDYGGHFTSTGVVFKW